MVELTETPGISYIRREGGYRTVYVYGSIDEEVIEPGEVVSQVKENFHNLKKNTQVLNQS